MFGVGFGDVRNRDELDAQSSVPTSDWALTIRNEAAIGETPGLMLYGIKNRTYTIFTFYKYCIVQLINNFQRFFSFCIKFS